MKDCIELLFDALTEGCSAQQIIELAQREILHNPVMLTNASFRVIGLSCDRDFDDPVWSYARLFNCCSRESIEIFRNDEASERLFSDGMPFLYDRNLGAKIPRILAAIKSRGLTLGYLILFYVDGEFRQEDLTLTERVCQCLSVALLKTERTAMEPQNIKDFTLIQLIRSGTDQTVDFAETVKNLNMRLKTYFQVAVLQFSTQKEEHYFPYFKQIIEEISPALSCVRYDHCMIILHNSDKKDDHSYLANIRQALTDFHISFGVSRTFTSLREIRYYAIQARKAIEIGRRIHPDRFCCFFKDYEFLIMLEHYSADQIRSMQSEEYLILKKYDARYDTEYLKTLKAYFENSLNRNATARALNIHRNTLTYRLDKISQLIQDDFSQIFILQGIYHSILTDEYLGSLK